MSEILEYLKQHKTISVQQATKLFDIRFPHLLFNKLLEKEVVLLEAMSSIGDPIRISLALPPESNISTNVEEVYA